MTDNYFTVMFTSRNKDNKELDGFKQRTKAFLHKHNLEEDLKLSDTFEGIVSELREEFLYFVDQGVEGEVSRMYVSINPRNTDKANIDLVHYLIDNPNTSPNNVYNKLVSFASKKENALSQRWLFDIDTDNEEEFNSVLDSIKYYGKFNESSLTLSRTVNGYAIVVPHGFDSRKVLEEYEFVELKRDGNLLGKYKQLRIK